MVRTIPRTPAAGRLHGIGEMVSLSATARAACDARLGVWDRARRFRCCLQDCDFVGHGFSPLLPPFSRDTRGRVGPARQARPVPMQSGRGAFWGGQETLLHRFVSSGDRKPGGRRSRSRTPPCRSPRRPQASFPARRARERRSRWERRVAGEIKPDNNRRGSCSPQGSRTGGCRAGQQSPSTR